MSVTNRPPLVLASGSPRRRDLLAEAGVAFDVRASGVPELRGPGEAPVAFAERVALAKANDVARRVGATPPRWVLGADTIVVLEDDVLGKPRDADDALALLSRLVGREHRVVTAVALVESRSFATHLAVVESTVAMRPAAPAELRAYVAGGEPLDKAGAYAVQGEGRRFVTGVRGSRTNVIGLPMERTLALLRTCGIEARP